MRIEQLHYFVETANQGSIHKASKKLHISHQSLSMSMNNLEKELNTTLFLRGTKGISLTASGYLMLQYAQDILKRTNQFISSLQNLSPTPLPTVVGSLHCMIAPNISLVILPQLIRHLSTLYPEITISLSELESALIIERILNGKHSLGLISTFQNRTPDFSTYPELIYKPLQIERNCVVVADTHPLAKYKSISQNTLLKYPLSVYQATDNEYSTLLDNLKTVGSPKLHMLSNNLHACKEVILTGQAVGLLPKQATEKELIFSATDPVTYITIKDLSPVVYAFLVNRSYYNSNQYIIDLLLEALQQIW